MPTERVIVACNWNVYREADFAAGKPDSHPVDAVSVLWATAGLADAFFGASLNWEDVSFSDDSYTSTNYPPGPGLWLWEGEPGWDEGCTIASPGTWRRPTPDEVIAALSMQDALPRACADMARWGSPDVAARIEAEHAAAEPTA